MEIDGDVEFRDRGKWGERRDLERIVESTGERYEFVQRLRRGERAVVFGKRARQSAIRGDARQEIAETERPQREQRRHDYAECPMLVVALRSIER